MFKNKFNIQIQRDSIENNALDLHTPTHKCLISSITNGLTELLVKVPEYIIGGSLEHSYPLIQTKTIIYKTMIIAIFIYTLIFIL